MGQDSYSARTNIEVSEVIARSASIPVERGERQSTKLVLLFLRELIEANKKL